MDYSFVIGNHRATDAGDLEKLEDSQQIWRRKEIKGERTQMRVFGSLIGVNRSKRLARRV